MKAYVYRGIAKKQNTVILQSSRIDDNINKRTAKEKNMHSSYFTQKKLRNVLESPNLLYARVIYALPHEETSQKSFCCWRM